MLWFKLATLWLSITKALQTPIAAINIIIAKGKALVMDAVCKAPNPPAKSKTDAITPWITTQKTLCQIGVYVAPPDASESTTKDPESAEVTKKVMIKITVIKDTIWVNGNLS